MKKIKELFYTKSFYSIYHIIMKNYYNFLFDKDKEIKYKNLSFFGLVNNLNEEYMTVKKIKNKHNEYFRNSFYGINKVLKNYLDYPRKKPINAIIEHGIYFRKNYVNREEKKTFLKNVITMGPFRKKIINELYDKKNIIIGPYINYATGLLTEKEITRIKLKYGKILLVIPSHSAEGEDSDYNQKEFLKIIKKMEKEFNSIWILMYWKDILEQKHKTYEAQGYNILSAGYIYDENFLNRLKDIILLSDYTISNSIGTHIGYCLSLNKPHYYYSQKINYKFNVEIDEKILEGFQKYFSKFDSISKKQIEFTEQFWGYSFFKEKSELEKTFFNEGIL